MSPSESRLLRAAHWAVAVTGIALVWMIFFAEADDPYSAVNHPWQPSVRSAHILAAPVLIFAVGMIWRPHAWSRIRAGFPHRRATGICLGLIFLPMAMSGYFLQIAVAETARSIWSWIHLAASGAWIVVWLLHRRTRRGAAATAA